VCVCVLCVCCTPRTCRIVIAKLECPTAKLFLEHFELKLVEPLLALPEARRLDCCNGEQGGSWSGGGWSGGGGGVGGGGGGGGGGVTGGSTLIYLRCWKLADSIAATESDQAATFSW
jgi:uncharacterized membrane protein YgcG